jgi:transitional endoplasmic reticulum ATPase
LTIARDVRFLSAMSSGNDREVRLQVAGAVAQDVGKGVARVSAEAMQMLGLRGGEIVAIAGKRRTGVIALPPYREDSKLAIVRLDGLARLNAGVGIGDSVTLERVEARPARRVVLGPAQPNVRLSGSADHLRMTLLNRPVATGDLVSTSIYQQISEVPGLDPFAAFLPRRAYGLAEIRLAVVSTQPKDIVVIGEETEIELAAEYQEPRDPRGGHITYDDVGGLRPAIDHVREMVELPLKHPELFRRLGIDPPKGVLLHGPPGTGKTLLARAVASESDAAFFVINGPEIVGKHYGESEERLRAIFEQAQKSAPSIIFIDEIDSIAPKRSEVTGEGERRLVAQLLTLMDGLEPRQNLVVIGATNRPDALDEALRRPGRFDRELVIGAPDRDGRREILEIHTRGMPLAPGVDLPELARITFGFVGADLAALCREAALEALRRVLPEIDLGKPEIPEEILAKLDVRQSDFHGALKRVQPSALREISMEKPNVGWDDIGGLDEAKRALREGIELPLRRPDAFSRLGIRPAKGFLLYGPPGTGKTLLAKAVAKEAEANFISVRSSDLLSKWYGESEKQVARLFARARQVAPTVIFIDEIDSLVPRRGAGLGEPAVTERVVNTILAEMDGLEELHGVVVIGATNQPSLIDPALLRPGRFDELIYVPVPDFAGRLRILKIHTQRMPLAPGVDLAAIARRTEGYTGADLEDLVRRAGRLALRHDLAITEVPMALFEQALAESRASVTKEMEAEYRSMAESLKRERVRTRRLGFE